MDTSQLIANIDDELARLKQVRALLAGGDDGAGIKRGRKATSFEFGGPHKRSTMSAEGRARIAAAQKKRWAKLKKAAAANGK